MDLVLKADADRDRLAYLEEEVERLTAALADSKMELSRVKREQGQSIAMLRQQLSPLYKALQDVFGEMDTIGGSETVAVNVTGNGNSKWEFWKKRYGGRIAEAIDLLTIQGSMNSKQLSHALRCDPRTLAKSVIYPMNQSGLINKNGGNFSLKEL